MLSNFQNDNALLIQIMLVGQPELRTRLKRPEFLQFAQRIAVHYHIEALDHDETIAYIQHRLRQAGGDPDLFSTQAMDHIFQKARGIPRNINMICDAALVYGFGYEQKTINTDIIDQVLQDKNDLGLMFIEENQAGIARLPGQPQWRPGICGPLFQNGRRAQ